MTTKTLGDEIQKIINFHRGHNDGVMHVEEFYKHLWKLNKEFIKKLLDYQDLKIKLNKQNKDLSKDEKELIFASLIDNKMSINELAGKELANHSQKESLK